MPILKIDHFPNEEDIQKLSKELDGYIKLVADIKKEILYGGSRLHADSEKILIDTGSLQENVWGGGVDLISKKIDCSAVANIRSSMNPSTEILNPDTRQKFIKIVKKYFPEFNP